MLGNLLTVRIPLLPVLPIVAVVWMARMFDGEEVLPIVRPMPLLRI